MAAKDTQNIASNAKRAATTLRNIAEMGVSLEDRGIMLAAARAVESFAKDRSAAAKRQKADEQARDRFIATETPKAKALIEAQWLAATMLDRCAILATDGNLCFVDIHIKHHRVNETRAHLERRFAESIGRSIESQASYIAWLAWQKKLPLQDVLDDRTKHLDAYRSHPETAAAAARFADFLERLDHKAAA